MKGIGKYFQVNIFLIFRILKYQSKRILKLNRKFKSGPQDLLHILFKKNEGNYSQTSLITFSIVTRVPLFLISKIQLP